MSTSSSQAPDSQPHDWDLYPVALLDQAVVTFKSVHPQYSEYAALTDKAGTSGYMFVVPKAEQAFWMFFSGWYRAHALLPEWEKDTPLLMWGEKDAAYAKDSNVEPLSKAEESFFAGQCLGLFEYLTPEFSHAKEPMTYTYPVVQHQWAGFRKAFWGQLAYYRQKRKEDMAKAESSVEQAVSLAALYGAVFKQLCVELKVPVDFATQSPNEIAALIIQRYNLAVEGAGGAKSVFNEQSVAALENKIGKLTKAYPQMSPAWQAVGGGGGGGSVVAYLPPNEGSTKLEIGGAALPLPPKAAWKFPSEGV